MICCITCDGGGDPRLSKLLACVVSIVLGCKQVVLVGDQQVSWSLFPFPDLMFIARLSPDHFSNGSSSSAMKHLSSPLMSVPFSNKN